MQRTSFGLLQISTQFLTSHILTPFGAFQLDLESSARHAHTLEVDMFIVHHIDSVIQVVLGVFFTWRGFRPKAASSRTTKIFRVCGPALVVIGGLLLLKPEAAPAWERAFTTDRVASVEFPGAPKAQESVDTLGDVRVKRTSFSYNVPRKDIALFLSFSQLQPEARGMTDDQMIEATVAFMTSQGNKVLENERVAASSPAIYRLTLRQEEKKATTQIALAYAGENVYRAVASWTDSEMDKSITDRFIGSFAVSDAGDQ